MSASVAISSSVTNALKSIPAAAKAASVGANTVNGPSACRAVTRFAALNAATNDVCIPVAIADVGMSTGAVHVYDSQIDCETSVKTWDAEL